MTTLQGAETLSLLTRCRLTKATFCGSDCLGRPTQTLSHEPEGLSRSAPSVLQPSLALSAAAVHGDSWHVLTGAVSPDTAAVCHRVAVTGLPSPALPCLPSPSRASADRAGL